MKFGKRLESEAIPSWRPYYLRYNLLKQKIKQIQNRKCENHGRNEAHTANGDAEARFTRKDFNKLVEEEIHRVKFFFGKLVKSLRDRQGDLMKRKAELISPGNIQKISGSELYEAFQALIQEYKQAGEELVLLFAFLELNLTGLRKILKKFEKRAGSTKGDTMLNKLKKHQDSQVALALQELKDYSVLQPLVDSVSASILGLQQHLNTLNGKNNATSAVKNVDVEESSRQIDQLLARIHEAKEKMQSSKSFLSFLSARAMIGYRLHSSRSISVNTPRIDGDVERKENLLSQYLNLASTFFYLCNYNICLPTAGIYAAQLGLKENVSGIIVGMTPFAAMVSALGYSYWSSYSFKQPLLCSTILLISGNALYATAWDYQDPYFLLLGRFVTGLGGCRAVNRRYIADVVSEKDRTSASSMFVAVSALGMAFGPLSAALFKEVDVNMFGFTFNHITGPGFVMVFIWAVFGVLLVLFFKEPEVASNYYSEYFRYPSNEQSKDGSDSDDASEGKDEELAQPESTPLLIPVGESKYGNGKIVNDEVKIKTKSKEIQGAGLKYGSINILSRTKSMPHGVRLWQNLMCLWVLFFAKLQQEALLTSLPIVTPYFYGWSPSSNGFFMAFLGILVVGSNLLFSILVSRHGWKDLYVIKVLQIPIVLACFLLIPLYEVPFHLVHMITGSIILFLVANALESFVMSYFSKIISKSLARGILNSGFLATEAGTFGRTVGNILITTFGNSSAFNLLRSLYGTELLGCILSIILLYKSRNLY